MLPLLLVFTVLLCLVGAQCPDGIHYDSSFQKCYQFVSTPTDFLTAEFDCRSIGGHLVTVGSGFENSLVGGMAFGRGNPWIGYNYLQKSLWSWTSGSNSTFVNWASGQPADPSAYQCASLRSTDNTWLKEMCSANRPYICDVSPNAATTTASPTASPGGALTCSTGYSMYAESNGKSMCYKVDYNYKTWQHAVDFCAQDGGVLPKIEDAGTNAFILALAEAYTFTNTEPWIGLICPSKKSSDCYWISDNSKLGNYQNWYSAQYPSGGSVNGTLMNTSAGAKDGTWGSANGFAPSSCQKDPVPMSEFVEEVRQRRAAEKKENKVGEKLRSDLNI